MDESTVRDMARRDLEAGGGMEFVRSRSVRWGPKDWLDVAAPWKESVEAALSMTGHNALWRSIEGSKPEALGLIKEGLGPLWTPRCERLAALAILAQGSCGCLAVLGSSGASRQELAKEAFWAWTLNPDKIAKSLGLRRREGEQFFWRAQAEAAGLDGHPYAADTMASLKLGVEAVYGHWEGGVATERLRSMFCEAGMWAIELGMPELMGAEPRAFAFARWLDGSLGRGHGASELSAVAVAEALSLRGQLTDGKAPARAPSKRM